MTNKHGKDKITGEQVLGLAPQLLELLKGVKQVELENFSMEIGDLDLFIPTGAFRTSGSASPEKIKPTQLIPESYIPVNAEYPGRIREVTLGATKSGGGSRGRSIVIGGSTAPAFSSFDSPPVHPPAISLDVFDMDVTLPKVLKENVSEVSGQRP